MSESDANDRLLVLGDFLKNLGFFLLFLSISVVVVKEYLL